MQPVLRLNTSTLRGSVPNTATLRLWRFQLLAQLRFEPLAQAAPTMRAHIPFTKGGVSSTVLDLHTGSQQGHPFVSSPAVEQYSCSMR
jgi:hypothetical protein